MSFYEAEAFCKWAGCFLPSEQQWEAAARGSEGRVYPWGDDWEDDICNCWEVGLRVTSPVGLFPRSTNREFELEDMAGNVWEWCVSRRHQGNSGRVLRGGSWYFNQHICRSAIRVVNPPGVRFNDDGFRAARTYT